MDARQGYAAAARAFADLVARLPATAYDGPGLGAWNLRSLIGHTARALVTVRTYLDQPAEEVALDSAAEYLTRATGAGPVADPAAVLERGRAAGAALGDDPAAFVRDLVDEVLAKVAGFGDGYVLSTVAGPMRLVDYLPTRTFELVVHGLDIARAAGVEATYPEPVVTQAVTLAGQVAVSTGRGPDLLLALTGRQPLGFSVV
jgi:uncharacterized protein (TIGR03083 family)